MLTDKCLSNNPRICVVGLGYVGLPLAIEFSKKYETVGFDINPIRVKELKTGKDSTLEVEIDSLKRAKKNLNFTPWGGAFCPHWPLRCSNGGGGGDGGWGCGERVWCWNRRGGRCEAAGGRGGGGFRCTPPPPNHLHLLSIPHHK